MASRVAFSTSARVARLLPPVARAARPSHSQRIGSAIRTFGSASSTFLRKASAPRSASTPLTRVCIAVCLMRVQLTYVSPYHRNCSCTDAPNARSYVQSVFSWHCSRNAVCAIATAQQRRRCFRALPSGTARPHRPCCPSIFADRRVVLHRGRLRHLHGHAAGAKDGTRRSGARHLCRWLLLGA